MKYFVVIEPLKPAITIKKNEEEYIMLNFLNIAYYLHYLMKYDKP